MRRDGIGDAGGYEGGRGEDFAEGWEDEPTALDQPIPMSSLIRGDGLTLARPVVQPVRR